jgi:uncharacterized protein YhfF
MLSSEAGRPRPPVFAKEYEPFTSEPLPRTGHFELLGYSDEACGIVEVTAVDVLAFADADSRNRKHARCM